MSNLKQRIIDSGNVPRRKLHVVKGDAGNADYLYDNLPSGTLFHTVQKAMAASRPFDEVIVWPGEYYDAGTITVPYEGMVLRGAIWGKGPGLAAAELWQYYYGTNVPVITVAAKGIEIYGLQVLPYADVTAIGIAVGTGVETKYCYIHDNYLRAVAAANMPTLISVGTAGTYDAQMCMIEDNYFRQGGCNTGDSAQIYLGQATGTTIRGNNFLLPGNSTNYNSINAGTAIVQRIVIQSNLFMAFEVGGCLAIDDGTGGTTDGHLYIDDNHFIGFTANANCFDYNVDNAGINYLNGAAITS